MKITPFLVALLLSACAVFAQIQTGRIAGTVYDPNKAVVPNATVTVTNNETKVAQKVLTNGAGDYVVPALNPGLYEIQRVGRRASGPWYRMASKCRSARTCCSISTSRSARPVRWSRSTAAVPLLNSESGSLGPRHDATGRSSIFR